VEVRTSPFAAPGAGRDDQPEVSVRNPLSAEESVLRTSLLTGLAAATVRNVSRGRADVALFETGSVFRDRRGPDVTPPPPAVRPEPAVLEALQASLPEQPLHAGWLIVGHAEPAGWWGPGRRADWTDAVAAAVSLARDLGVRLEIAAGERSPWHPGRCAVLCYDGVELGCAGELHPEAVEAFGLPAGACAGELDLGPLLALDPGPVKAPRPSGYPASSVDVALVVPLDTPQSPVLMALRDGAGPLLESSDLLSVFAGGSVAPGHVSLAYRLRFRAPDRTLSGEEVNAFRDAAVASAAAATGAVLRT
jgi:phenylalanyl-tRNA synthetase beta chain